MAQSKDFSMVLDNGMDLDIGAICGCTQQRMSECEKKCHAAYGCNNIAIANTILSAYENGTSYDANF